MRADLQVDDTIGSIVYVHNEHLYALSMCNCNADWLEGQQCLAKRDDPHGSAILCRCCIIYSKLEKPFGHLYD